VNPMSVRSVSELAAGILLMAIISVAVCRRPAATDTPEYVPANRVMSPVEARREPEAPRVLLDTTYAPGAGRVQTLSRTISGAEFQAALDRAQPGDVLELQPGATIVGNFVLPKKAAAVGSSNWIVIRSAAKQPGIPAPGIRVSPKNAAAMPELIGATSDPLITAAPGSHHYRFVGVEFTMKPGGRCSNLIRLGEGDETDAAMLPHDIIIDRCYIHGNPTATLRRAIALNCARAAVIDSYISECHEAGADSQAICGWNGPGPFKIVNNYLEAAGENVMFGGADPKIDGLIPSDIEFRDNHCFKPLTWKAGHPTFAGTHWSIKNLFELKNAQRVLVERNMFENVWLDAQTGYAVLFKSVNQDGAAKWSVTQDVMFRNNIVRHAGGALNLQGTAPDQPGGKTRRITIQNNLFDDVNGKAWGGDGVFLKVTECEDVTVDHNTVIHTGNIITAYGPPSVRFVFTNNVLHHNEYGVKGDGTAPGMNTLEKYFPGCVFRRNLIAGNRDARYPADNFLVPALANAAFANPSALDYRLSAGSQYKGAGTDGRDLGCDLLVKN